MSYGCRTTCDNCRPKYVICPACGKKNFLTVNKCSKCRELLTQEMKDAAVAEWVEKSKTREISACYSSLPQ